METKWTDSLLNDTQGIDLGSYNLKYGPSYKSAEDYIPESDAARIFWTQHNVKWNGISGFTANPFGNFEIENDNTASFMNNINGGTELLYKTADGSFRTSNIKEIICMTDIYTMYSTEASPVEDEDTMEHWLRENKLYAHRASSFCDRNRSWYSLPLKEQLKNIGWDFDETGKLIKTQW